MIKMFVSYQKFFAVPLVVYEHVYEVSSLYYIGKLGFQNPCFSTDSREISGLARPQGRPLPRRPAAPTPPPPPPRRPARPAPTNPGLDRTQYRKIRNPVFFGRRSSVTKALIVTKFLLELAIAYTNTLWKFQLKSLFHSKVIKVSKSPKWPYFTIKMSHDSTTFLGGLYLENHTE